MLGGAFFRILNDFHLLTQWTIWLILRRKGSFSKHIFILRIVNHSLFHIIYDYFCLVWIINTGSLPMTSWHFVVCRCRCIFRFVVFSSWDSLVNWHFSKLSVSICWQNAYVMWLWIVVSVKYSCLYCWTHLSEIIMPHTSSNIVTVCNVSLHCIGLVTKIM